MLEPQPPRPEPSAFDAVVRAVEAGQRLVLARLELLRLDLSDLATRSVRGAGLIAVGAFLLAAAWCALMAAAAAWLRRYLSLPQSLAVVALATAAAGAVAIAAGVSTGRGGTADKGDEGRR